MIEKLKVVIKPEDWELPVNELEMRCLKNLLSKMDELVDAVNELQERVNDHEQAFDDCARDITKTETMLKNINTTVGSLITDNNIHEKQIDGLKTRDEELAERINYTLAKATGDKEVLKLLDEKHKPVDRFAEQRKWVGKLCRCWDSDINDDIWGILQDIKDNKTEKYYLYGIGYEHCEPVKPDDDIVYKEEQQ